MDAGASSGMSVKVQCLITSYGVHVAVSSGHPTTVFCTISVWRSKSGLEIFFSLRNAKNF